MAFIVGLGALLIIISLVLQFDKDGYHLIDTKLGKIIVAIIWGVPGILVGACLAAGVAFVAANNLPNQTYCDAPVNTQLVSIRGDNNLAGSFLYIDSEYTYHYFDNDHGAISEHNIDGQLGEVFEDSTVENAHVANFSFEYQWYLRPFVIGNGGYACKTQFHVPPGSVSRAIQVSP